MNECILVYYPEDAEAPKSVRFWTVDAGRVARQRMQAKDETNGTWKLHMVGEAFE